MRRPASTQRYSWREFDVRNDIDPERLAAIGALAVGFNDLEAMTNTMLPIVLETPYPLWTDITTRITGLESKFDIIKRSIRQHLRPTDDVADLLCDAIGGMNSVRQYRDAVVHVKLIDPDAIIAPTVAKRSTEYEVLVSQEALDWLNDQIAALREEMSFALLLVHQIYVIRHYEIRHPVTVLDDGSADPERQRLEQEIQELIPQLQERQKFRQSLPLPPKFPEEAAVSTDPDNAQDPKR